jgi:SagB-type dehydrogenase family enzyme
MLPETKAFHVKTQNRALPQVSASPPPASHTQVYYKEYPRFEAFDLPDAPVDERLEILWRGRRSIREFAPGPIGLDDVAAALRSCRIVDPDRQPERRTYPSAGARFPIEIYVAAFRVDGLTQGFYHYKVRTNQIEFLWPGDLDARSAAIVSPFVADPPVALILTSVLSRSEVKYGHKAYNFSLLEAGHMAQNIQLACEARGLGSCGVGGYVDGEIADLLDLTEEELPLYAIALGRPRDDAARFIESPPGAGGESHPDVHGAMQGQIDEGRRK